jgi:hypothetical protein
MCFPKYHLNNIVFDSVVVSYKLVAAISLMEDFQFDFIKQCLF